MSRIRVSVLVNAAPEVVWSQIEDIGSHVDWMADAVAIRFHADQRSGVGTSFECDTRFGPFKLTDQMEITEWRPGGEMGVRHSGIVSGSGRFTLRGAPGGGTRFTWDERLTFPWWMGGPLGALVAKPVMAGVWRRNLRRLRTRVEAGTGA